jgi:hypothetical protein
MGRARVVPRHTYRGIPVRDEGLQKEDSVRNGFINSYSRRIHVCWLFLLDLYLYYIYNYS